MFVEESLDYYERKLFGRPVLRVPHPSFLRWTKTHLFSDPVKAAIVDELEIPLLQMTRLEVMVRDPGLAVLSSSKQPAKGQGGV
jgi:hypothetical protein